MADWTTVVRSRRMARAFEPTPVPDAVLETLIDDAARAPSAGKSQGWHAVLLQGAETRRFWDITLPGPRRESFAWPHLLDAPTLLVLFADPHAYVERYREPDKVHTGLGVGVDAWSTPYWTVDAGMATMSLLHGAENAGLGALFFAVFAGEAELRTELNIPERLQTIGAVALGYPRKARPGRSSGRRRRAVEDVVHDARWGVQWRSGCH